MQTITKCLVLIVLFLSVQLINAQDSISKINNKEKIESLEKIRIQERNLLKIEVEVINKRLEKGEITEKDAEDLKMKVAKKHALNIENRIAIIENKASFQSRNPDRTSFDENEMVFRIGGSEGGDSNFVYFGKQEDDKPKNRKYDRRTSSDFVLAFGLNNAIVDDESLDDSPYKFGGSRFLELGWAWKTRVLKNSNFIRFKYGYSFQINGLKPIDNQYFVKQGDQTLLEEFPEDLNKSKLSITNLVFPVHFEFGPSKKIERDTYFRYSTHNKFKIGVGGYAGFNIGSRQKLKYELNGENIKDKQKRSFNTTNLVYGLSSYIALGNTALYVKYDLSPIFKDQFVDQNNISVGVRFDMN
ncbi:MAG: hypothetical protein ABJL44_16165 [Algibacter sp.]